MELSRRSTEIDERFFFSPVGGYLTALASAQGKKITRVREKIGFWTRDAVRSSGPAFGFGHREWLVDRWVWCSSRAVSTCRQLVDGECRVPSVYVGLGAKILWGGISG
jgi:hypothetical protein